MLKLYVLIRDDLSPAQQAVQAGHAVAQFGYDHPLEFRTWQIDNNTLIYLSVSNIGWWKQVLEDGGFKHSLFHDPDLRTPGLTPGVLHRIGLDTAIAVAPNWTTQYLLFKNLPLALQPEKPKRWWKR